MKHKSDTFHSHINIGQQHSEQSLPQKDLVPKTPEAAVLLQARRVFNRKLEEEGNAHPKSKSIMKDFSKGREKSYGKKPASTLQERKAGRAFRMATGTEGC